MRGDGVGEYAQAEEVPGVEAPAGRCPRAGSGKDAADAEEQEHPRSVDRSHDVCSPLPLAHRLTKDEQSDEGHIELHLVAESPKNGIDVTVAENALQVDEVGEHLTDGWKLHVRVSPHVTRQVGGDHCGEDGSPVERRETKESPAEKVSHDGEVDRLIPKAVSHHEPADDEEDLHSQFAESQDATEVEGQFLPKTCVDAMPLEVKDHHGRGGEPSTSIEPRQTSRMRRSVVHEQTFHWKE